MGEDWFCQWWGDNDGITLAYDETSGLPWWLFWGDHINDILTCLTPLEETPWYNRSTRQHWSTWRPCNTRSAFFGLPGPPAFLQSNMCLINPDPVPICWILRFIYSSCWSTCCKRGCNSSKCLFHSECLLPCRGATQQCSVPITLLCIWSDIVTTAITS